MTEAAPLPHRMAALGRAWDLPLAGRILIEASAGTGKTYTIADLVLRLVLGDALQGYAGPSVTIDRILVVTFTRAAAAELRERIRRRLRDALRAAEAAEAGKAEPWATLRAATLQPEVARARLRSALADIDRAAISTIHGFCQTILAESALATGTGTALEVVGDDKPRLKRIAHDFHLRRLAAANADPRTVEACRNQFKANVIERFVALGMEVLQQPAGADGPLLLPPAFEDHEREQLRVLLAEFVAQLPEAWDAAKQQSGTLTYGDLQRQLDHALVDPGLRAALATRFPVALVDEFQDTDPVQWAIFDRIWTPVFDKAAGGLLAMIGDPKQAIYGFRGGDVHTYLAARQTANAQTSLDCNYRSDPELVGALDDWLGDPAQQGAWGQGIDWPPVGVPRTRRRRLDPATAPAVQLEWTASGDFRVGDIPRVVVRWVREIVGGFAMQADGDRAARPLRYDDIAVLVPSASKGKIVHAALTRAGIPAALQTKSSVFATAIAGDLLAMLTAVLDPERRELVARAAASALVGLRSGELESLFERDDLRAAWVGHLVEVRQLWERRGPAQALGRLLDEPLPAPAMAAPRERLLTWPDGLRIVTDLRHLVDLLAAEAQRSHLRPEALVEWFERRIASVGDEDVAADELQLRLDRDDAAVRIMTVHASKGLEFPVVLLPYAVAETRGGSGFPWAHPATSAGSTARSGVWLGADVPKKYAESTCAKDPFKALSTQVATRLAQEQDAEQHRLFYVAITRAALHLRMLWFRARGAPDRPLSQRILATLNRDGDAFALHPQDHHTADQGKRDQAMIRTAEAMGRFADIQDRPGRWATVRLGSGHGHEAAAPPQGRIESVVVPTFAELPPAPAGLNWRVHSFTSLKGTVRASQGFGSDLRLDEEGRPFQVADDPWPIEFSGTAAGHVVHDLLESAFANPDHLRTMAAVSWWTGDAGGADLKREARALLRRHRAAGDPDKVLSAVGLSVQAALTRELPLGGDSPPVRLAELAGHSRAELGFLAPLARMPNPGAALGGTLADLLISGKADDQRMAAWLRSTPARPVAGLLEGMLTGFIDLVFEHDGRLWLVDWKTNRLPESHSPAEHLMAMQGYGLQALLYALAARRLLSVRGRDPDRDFGGVLYVFLRAFGAANHETALQRGLVCCRPSSDRLAAAEQFLFAAGESAR